MGSTRWASGSIAGVSLVDSGSRDCRIDVLDGEALRETLIGNTVSALDLTVHTQLITRQHRSVHFGVHVAQLPSSKRDAVITAIEAAIGGGGTFPVIMADATGTDNISVSAVPDYAAQEGKLHKRGTIAAGYVKDVVFRFISTGVYP